MSLIIFLQETMVDYGAFAAIGAGLAAIGAGIGIQFKGSGFYCTDSKSKTQASSS